MTSTNAAAKFHQEMAAIFAKHAMQDMQVCLTTNSPSMYALAYLSAIRRQRDAAYHADRAQKLTR